MKEIDMYKEFKQQCRMKNIDAKPVISTPPSNVTVLETGNRNDAIKCIKDCMDFYNVNFVNNTED